MINLSKRVDLGSEFGKRERHYLKQLEKAALEKREVIKELRAHDELISIASHELKTPLTSTLLKLQIALDNIKNVSLANFSIQNLLDMLESAEEQAQSLGKMINNLLSLSLLKSGRMQLDFEEADLGKVTENIVNRFKERAKKEQIKIEYMGRSQKLTTVIDRVKIEQAHRCGDH
jgi:signal transduction histidine kinase